MQQTEEAATWIKDPTTSTVDIQEVLVERGAQYGDFDTHAHITQAIKRAMVDSPNWSHLADDQREAIEMVAHKIGRILNGNPNFLDSWVDCIGYLQLVVNRLESGEEA